MEEKETIQMPVNRLSYSTLTQLCRNPIIFKLKSILGVYSGKRGVAGMIGGAAHEALKFYYGGNEDYPVPIDRDEARAECIEFGLKFLEQYDDRDIRFGKTGTREKMIQGYVQAMQLYFAEEPEYHKVLICEKKLESEMKTKSGDALPLPGVAIPDLVVENEDESVDIIDTKFVTSFTPYEDEDGEPNEDAIKIIQAKMLDHCLLGSRGIQARQVIFREVKRSKNMAGGNQIQDYIIPLDHEAYDIAFYNFYRDCVKFISNPNVIYLPNFCDPYDGKEAWLMYTQGMLSADMSDVEVMHRVKDVAFTSKKFISSNLDRIENANLAPEEKIKVRLREFGVLVEPVETMVGASVIQYRFKVSAGTRMAMFSKHKADIARAIEAKGEIRILAPIPGTSFVGIEVSAEYRRIIYLTKKDLVPNTLTIPIGVDVNGVAYKVLLNHMPHLLIAGTTGGGKSVELHSILWALTQQMKPSDMRLILIDPKRVELKTFEKVKHLDGKIIHDQEEATLALLSIVDEMDERYKLLETTGSKNIDEFNEGVAKGSITTKKMPYKIVVVDEFADLILRSKIDEKTKKTKSYSSRSVPWLYREIERREINAPNMSPKTSKTEARAILADILDEDDEKDASKRPDANVELLMVRLAQLGRAAGIHIIIATQQPTVNVVTGLIKANFPARIALLTSSPIESEVILGERGAEKLSGKGDMLFMHPGANGRQRLQGFMIEK